MTIASRNPTFFAELQNYTSYSSKSVLQFLINSKLQKKEKILQRKDANHTTAQTNLAFFDLNSCSRCHSVNKFSMVKGHQDSPLHTLIIS